MKSEISGVVLNELRELCNFSPDIDLKFRSAARTFPSTALLLPKPSVWGNRTLITTPKRTYTANDYQALFNDMGYPEGFSIYSEIAGINAGFPSPKVPVYCFYGTEVTTPESYVYDWGFPDSAPTKAINGDGDGTVNRLSAEVCLKWSTQQRQTFMAWGLPGVDHLNIVMNTKVLKAIDIVVM